MTNPTFPPNKTAEQLGCKIGELFRVEDNGNFSFGHGDILEFFKDTYTDAPAFKRLSDGRKRNFCWFHLSRYEEPKSGFHKGGLIPGKTIVIDESGKEVLILEAGETSFMPSMRSDFEVSSSCWLTYKEAIEKGWQIKEEPKTVKYSNQEHWEDVAKTEEKIKAFEEWIDDTGFSVHAMKPAVKAKVRQLFGDNS